MNHRPNVCGCDHVIHPTEATEADLKEFRHPGILEGLMAGFGLIPSKVGPDGQRRSLGYVVFMCPHGNLAKIPQPIELLPETAPSRPAKLPEL